MKLISNKPIGRNEFPQNEKCSLVDQLAGQIINPQSFTVDAIDASRVSVIGIEGRWGSGKSNLVKMVKERLHSQHLQKKFFFFEFDLWAHQNELTRKSILEELVDSLANGKLLKRSEYWRTEVKRLTGLTIERSQYHTPHFSIVAVVWMVCITMTPIFSVLATLFRTQCSQCPLWVAAIPLVVAVLCFSIQFIVELKSQGWHKVRDALSKACWVYQKKEVSSSTTDFQHECEPTIFSFRNFLKNLSLDMPEGLRTVLIFDNIDRLPIDKVKSFWSSAHMLFADCSKDSGLRFVTIVPFDREHVRKAFLEQGDSSIKSYIGDDYINKTFDVIYRVAPPIMDDWVNYLRAKLTLSAEGDCSISNHDIFNIIQVFNREYPRDEITPRSILGFVNAIATEHNLQPNVPAIALSLFVIEKSKLLINNPAPAIVSGDFITNKVLKDEYINDETLQSGVSALVYQVDLNAGKTIALKKVLLDALNCGDAESVSKISNHSSFVPVYYDAVQEVQGIDNIPKALSGLKSPSVDEDTIDSCWKMFLADEMLNKLLALRDDNPDIEDWALDIVTYAPMTYKRKFVKRYMLAHRLSAKPDIGLYLSRAKKINDLTRSDGFLVADVLDRKVYDNPDDIQVIVESAPKLYHDLSIGVNTDALDAALSNGNEVENNPVRYKWLLGLNAEDAIRLNNVRVSLSNKNIQQVTPQAIENAIEIIKILDYITPIAEHINTSISIAILSKCIEQCEDTELLPLLVAERFRKSPGLEDDRVSVGDLSKSFLRVMSFNELVDKFGLAKCDKMYCRCLSGLFKSGNTVSKVETCFGVIDSLQEIINTTGMALNEILEVIKGLTTDDIKAIDFKNRPPISSLQLLVNRDEQVAVDVIDHFRSWIESRSAESWDEDLLSHDENRFIKAIEITDAQLGRDFVWRAFDIAEKVLHGEIQQIPNLNNWRIVFDVILKKHRSSGEVENRLRQDLESDKISPLNKQQFLFAGEAILRCLKLEMMPNGLYKILTAGGVREDGDCQRVYLKYPNGVIKLFRASNASDDFKQFLLEQNVADEKSIFYPLRSLV